MKHLWKICLFLIFVVSVSVVGAQDPENDNADWQPILPFDGSISEQLGDSINDQPQQLGTRDDLPRLADNEAFTPIIPYDGSISLSYREELQGSVIYPPRTVMDFTLPSTTGEPFTLSDHRGKLVMLYFGYLTCPDVCPTTMADMLRAYRDAGEPSDRVTVVFVTIDPERDTMEYMTRYVNAFHKDFIGVTPENQEQLDQLLASYGVTATRREVDSATKYLIDHSAAVLMIAPDGRMVEQFPFGVSYTEIAHDLEVLMEYMLYDWDVEQVIGEVTTPDPAREYRIVIPDGTYYQIQMGQDPGVIPLEINLTLGEKDILVLENHDNADYLVGGIWVAPNETVSKQFYAPQTFVGLCTVTVGRDLIEIIVSEPDTGG